MRMIDRRRIHDLVDGDGRASETYSRAMCAVIVASLIPLCLKEPAAIFGVLEAVCTSVFVADYLMRLVTADFKFGKGKASFLLYPSRRWP